MNGVRIYVADGQHPFMIRKVVERLVQHPNQADTPAALFTWLKGMYDVDRCPDRELFQVVADATERFHNLQVAVAPSTTPLPVRSWNAFCAFRNAINEAQSAHHGKPLLNQQRQQSAQHDQLAGTVRVMAGIKDVLVNN